MNSTDKYIKEHEEVFSLPRRQLSCQHPKQSVGWSVSRLLLMHIKSTLGCLLRLPSTAILFAQDLYRLSLLKDTGSLIPALVIGNGPSQGTLTLDNLREFRDYGGQTLCVNYYYSNPIFDTYPPDWLILSDPNTLNDSPGLMQRIRNNVDMKLLLPLEWKSKHPELARRSNTYFFNDTFCSSWSNINPLFPRGYVSMTLYKALAIANYVGFSHIGVIGMDNSYPRTIYNDPDNHVCNLESHSSEPDWLSDQSELFPNVASLIEDFYLLFHHLTYFPNHHTYNLDPYSLTDRFRKISINRFIECFVQPTQKD